MMRHANQSTVFLLAITLSLTLSGCGTTSASRTSEYQPGGDTSPAREYDSAPRSHSPKPPPPAPAAYGVSHVKRVGFLRIFGEKNTARKRACGDDCVECDPCKNNECCEEDGCSESCCSPRRRGLFGCLREGKYLDLFRCKSWDTKCGESVTCCDDTDACCDDSGKCGSGDDCCFEFDGDCGEGCDNDRHRCWSEGLDDPFLDDIQNPEPVPELPAVPKAPEHVSVAPQPVFPSPFTGISSGKPSGNYFPAEFGQQRSVIEPPQWRGHHTTESTARFHSVTLQNTVLTEPSSAPQIPHRIMIQPRQHLRSY